MTNDNSGWVSGERHVFHGLQSRDFATVGDNLTEIVAAIVK